MRRPTGAEKNRHRVEIPCMNRETERILNEIELTAEDKALCKSIYFGPTALTLVRRLIDNGGTIIADTQLIANEIRTDLLGTNGAKIACYIDSPDVVAIAEQRRVMRAEVAVDFALSEKSPKLFIVGSAPATIQRLLIRRQHEPLTDVGILAAPTGFASVIQLKEKLVESSFPSIVVRGKKGGIQTTALIANTILKEIQN